ncbi:MAG: hypothetical protein ACTSRA_00500 [Promethearchaeota archaeon]|nr:MAG: hypothetical protein [Helarchaeota virus Nidhogg Meg22_1012]URC17437.1 MAG: hypothetical protein [Helarchaeota virus Nidhogg Meg22_1214]
MKIMFVDIVQNMSGEKISVGLDDRASVYKLLSYMLITSEFFGSTEYYDVLWDNICNYCVRCDNCEYFDASFMTIRQIVNDYFELFDIITCIEKTILLKNIDTDYLLNRLTDATI